MAHLRLAAGTDVAEMAFFDVNALPQSRPVNSEELDSLVAQHSLIRLPTGADGSYLLHLYVDEPLPDQIREYCQTEDKLKGYFFSKDGRIAFGGVESAFQSFKPNRFIRSDAIIPPGSYAFVAYHTDIPDEDVAKAIRSAIAPKEKWLSRAPSVVPLLTLGLVFTSLIAQSFAGVGVALFLGYLSLKIVKRLPAYQALAARLAEAQRDFPSIAIEMRSTSTH